MIYNIEYYCTILCMIIIEGFAMTKPATPGRSWNVKTVWLLAVGCWLWKFQGILDLLTLVHLISFRWVQFSPIAPTAPWLDETRQRLKWDEIHQTNTPCVPLHGEWCVPTAIKLPIPVKRLIGGWSGWSRRWGQIPVLRNGWWHRNGSSTLYLLTDCAAHGNFVCTLLCTMC